MTVPIGPQDDRVSLVIIDGKGDPALLHKVRLETEKRGQDFLFFSLEQGADSCSFNPFLDLRSESRTLVQFCDLNMNSLALAHGPGYGRSFFTNMSREALQAAISLAEKERGKVTSFDQLYDALNRLSTAQKREAGELLSIVNVLRHYRQLCSDGKIEDAKNTIHMPNVLRKRQVVYFWLRAALESVSVREVANLAIYSLLTAAIDRQRAMKPGEPLSVVYLVIDEFQRFAGDNFKIVLEQARSFGISAILANQSFSDLKTASHDLRHAVRTNTRVKFFFSVTDPEEVDLLCRTSGEEIRRMSSSSTTSEDAPLWKGKVTGTESSGEVVCSRLTPNDIYAISDHPNRAVMHVSRSSGYTQFGGLAIPVEMPWMMSKAEYDELSRMPLPQLDVSSPAVHHNLKSAQEIEEEVRRANVGRLQDTLTDLFEHFTRIGG